ncbi:ABC-type transport auxiliary lipoprotein family protein [Methylococcus capsulatus]|uniref:ABC-type transport auxiliary lipoprotein family protein n=1 Tax=Methylococcus capsulatus TaxID=414 RepID=UPI00211B13DF|nr:PqiC family protein [Methylococcus capsulatus]
MMRRLSWTLMLSLATSACSLLPERPPQPAQHDFGAAGAAAPAPWSSVDVDAPEWLRNDRLQYRLLYAKPTELRSYTLDRWIAPPSELLEQRLKAGRSANGYRLHIELQAFEQVFERPGSSHVMIRLRAETPADTETFQFDQPTASPDAAGAVQAFAQAVDRAVAQLRAWRPAN